ncbi:hypothetical protein KUTeg_018908 [Tegillarca granosa]|uniref:CUB domain-containing protein n=1 Tax=Tegillarca granosa TaxID=220873 RepID=A0ABQ9EB03_TEGGR|nr:hypothetical protein KUTeg_018908 [Tegillarca granosa]
MLYGDLRLHALSLRSGRVSSHLDMLFCFGLFALLLYNTVVANEWLFMKFKTSFVFLSAVCSFTYSKKDKINASSLVYDKEGYAECEFVIKAPRNNYIVLNLTDLIGFHWYPGSSGGSTTTDLNTEATNVGGSYKQESTGIPFVRDNCLPPELIIEETFSGKEATITKNRICNSQSYKIPQVFHSKANLLKIIYIWIPEEHNNCVFTVMTQNSCNEEYNCRDKTDESNCSSIQSQAASPYVIKIVVIVVIVVLMPVLAALVCVASPLRLTSLEQNLLTTKPAQTQTFNIDLPPQIPISRDGEEGYTESQKQLLCQRKNNNGYQEIFRPAPNKTVFDKDSPPPYCSHSISSASSVDNLGHSGSSTRPVVGDCNGYSVMFQCCSNHTHHNNCLHLHDSSSRTRTMLSSSSPSSMAGARYSRNIKKSSRNSLDRPPDYHKFEIFVKLESQKCLKILILADRF